MNKSTTPEEPTSSPDDRSLRGSALLTLVVLAAAWGLANFTPPPEDQTLAEIGSQLNTAINIGMVVAVPVLLAVLCIVGMPARRELVAGAASGVAGATVFLAAAVAVGFAGWNPTWSLVALFLVAIPFSRWVYRRFAP